MTNYSTFTVGTLPTERRRLVLKQGRNLWALETLMAAGSKGVTPIDNPAPRWSAYVFNLREMGVEIETIHEPHDGAFQGTHARYVLRSHVTREGA